MISPGGINLRIHGSNGQMLPFELNFLLNIGILELMVIFLEPNLDLIKAHIEVPFSLFKLSAPDSKIVLKIM